MRGAALILVVTALVAGCADDGPATRATDPGTVALPRAAAPTVAQTHQTPTAMEPGAPPPPTPPPAPAPPTATSTTAAAPSASPSRTAPLQDVREMRFDEVRVFAAANGDFAGRASMTNVGRDTLTAIVVYWNVRTAAGKVLDRGQLQWPSLAPGETATIQLTGAEPYRGDWRRVKFDYALAGVEP